MADDVAVTMIGLFGTGNVAGAVYSPVWSIVPLAPPPVTAHVTVWLVVLLTEAENCCCCAGAPAKLGYSVLTDPGVTVTTGG